MPAFGLLISADGVQVGVLISGALLTAIGLVRYWLYTRERYRLAHACLLVCSSTGLLTLGHFRRRLAGIAPLW